MATIMFKFLIVIRPLGFLYGSAGAFLSPENLVGLSGTKFPPDAATLSGLILGTNQEKEFTDHQQLKANLTVAGAFWAQDHDPENFFVAIPRSLTIGKDECAEWEIKDRKWHREVENIKADYSWQSINYWNDPIGEIHKHGVPDKLPWKFNPILHPTLEDDQRHVRIPKDEGDRGSLFLENAVQMREDSCLVYLSTHELPDGWYRFGGENHMVEIESLKLDSNISDLFKQPITKSFALISPAVWGTNNLSQRYPPAFKDGDKPPKMLCDRPVPFRYRIGGKLGIGRYAVPAGTVYVLKHDLNKTWWDFPNEWFPQSKGQVSSDKNTLLKQLGCGLCLPIKINGVD